MSEGTLVSWRVKKGDTIVANYYGATYKDGKKFQSSWDSKPFETVIGESKIQFTPQKKFFDTTQNWAVALQDIYGGDDAASRLRSLAKTNTSKVNL